MGLGHLPAVGCDRTTLTKTHIYSFTVHKRARLRASRFFYRIYFWIAAHRRPNTAFHPFLSHCASAFSPPSVALISPAAITNHGGAPGESGLRALSEVVHGRGSTVGHLEVGVDVNATGDHHLAVGLDGLDPTRHDQVVTNLPVKGR